MSRAEHEQLPPPGEKPREVTIDKFLGLLTTFTKGTFSRPFEKTDFDRDEDGFDKISVVINDPQRRLERNRLIGKITYTTKSGASEVSTSYHVFQGTNGREVKYAEDSTLVSRSKPPKVEKIAKNDREGFEKITDINVEEEMRLFEEDLGTVTEEDFRGMTDELEKLMIRYNIY